ncbi:MAG: hypothetical protein M1838_005809, partial [Thelocarpon superellum]
ESPMNSTHEATTGEDDEHHLASEVASLTIADEDDEDDEEGEHEHEHEHEDELDDSDNDGFCTDDEYDILDASDEEMPGGVNGGKASKMVEK